jgi:hypothetical protein
VLGLVLGDIVRLIRIMERGRERELVEGRERELETYSSSESPL